jgi:SAM-dependent methyltransferase
MTEVSLQAYINSFTAGQSVMDEEMHDHRGLKPTERLFIEEALLLLYPRLKHYDLIPWKWLNGPLIPDFIARHTDPGLRRIVEIGCGDGVFTNILSLLFPNIEIIGIDTDPDKIAAARATIGYRQNLKFICANAAVLVEIPCDRIIYNHCLSRQNTVYGFKKLVLKTSQWLVDEGDYLIKESPLQVAKNFPLMKELFPLWRAKKSFSACLRSLLGDLGHHNPLIFQSPGVLGWPSEIFCQASRGLMLTGMVGHGAQASVAEWQDWGAQSDDSLLKFLFSNGRADFSQELK